MEAYAWNLGATVEFGAIPKGIFFPPRPAFGIPGVIGVPEGNDPLPEIWALAHELGHLVQHTGPKGELFWSKNEVQANRWAACALIPKARILLHCNACEDSMIAALSAHYQDLPLFNCPTRQLAGKIAKIRLHALSRDAA
jgi:hypothetical protein